MDNYTKEELEEALRAISSLTGKCEKAQRTWMQQLKACLLQKKLLSQDSSNPIPNTFQI